MAEFITQREKTRRIATLVICIVIDVAAIGGAVYAGKRANDLRSSPNIPENLQNVVKILDEEQKKLGDLDQSFLEFSVPIGWRVTTDPSRPELPETHLDAESLQNTLDAWWAILATRYGVTQYASWTSGAGKPLHILELMDELDRLTQERLKEAEAIRVAVGKYDEEKKEWSGVKGDESKALADQRKMEEEKSTTIRERMADSERLRGELDGLLQRTQDEQKTKQDEKNAARLALSGRVQEMYEEDAKVRAEIAELQERVDAIVESREQAEELKQPDGRVIFVDRDLGTIYVNIGASEGLFEGTRFEVMGVERGGKKVPRGMIRIAAIDALFSRAQVVRLREGESIHAGDFLYNNLYDGAQVKRFVLAGRFVGRYTKDELARKIDEFGERFSPGVTKDTHYCVIGEGYETDPVYLEALRIGVKVIREKTLLDYLGVRRE